MKPKSSLAERQQSAPLFGGSATFVESLYERYLDDPASVSPAWQAYFEATFGGGDDTRHQPILEQLKIAGRERRAAAIAQPAGASEKQANVLKMVNAYRVRGHQQAKLDPLALTPRPDVPDLDLGFHNLSESDLATAFNTGSLVAADEAPLRDILDIVQQTYCGSIGVEYMHITDTRQRRWLQQRLEGAAGQFGFTAAQQREILQQLTAAEGLERYLGKKYVGQKRFSLEGGESLIPLLHGLIQRAGAAGQREIVFGMAHRGRLNVLVNVLGKSPRELFEEFEGKKDIDGMGDVKYHLGFSSDVPTPGGDVHLAMGFNPSHLEIIDPVVAGSVRARQARRQDTARRLVMPVLMHGDAAFAGQGVVMELFNMSQARGFAVGGTFHIIINNQIGFTTSNPLDARSTLYCTEVAKLVQAPILHVNGDDPEAVMFAMQVLHDFRAEFDKDVVLDLVCYRRHGHNEADEPAATQPLMYQRIRSMPTTRAKYAATLTAAGIVDNDAVDHLTDAYRDALDQGEPVANVSHGPFDENHSVDWTDHLDGELDQTVDTTVELEDLQQLATILHELPAGAKLHNRVQRVVDDRIKMAAGETSADWGFCEIMAYATLIDAGHPLRLVGQDSGRGTFFHRHAVLHEQVSGEAIVPLERLSDDPQMVTIIDSLLSEEAVLGFEYGYASTDPQALVIWEAQFGDFVNGAQVVIDQFISSGEAKWGRLCGLVMLLPHGYEGQGPEHSSARLERFLQLCAQNNMQVCVPSTPGQIFHMLRRQMLRSARKPLIVMTPKSLLRKKESFVGLDTLTDGEFQAVIDEHTEQSAVKRIVLCSGKVYYDLLAERDKRNLNDIALVRVEQLYPFPRAAVKQILGQHADDAEVVWCQEEPMNQGAWFQIKHHLQYCVGNARTVIYAGRQRSPSPAVGQLAKHLSEQKTLVDDALTLGKGTEFSQD